MKIYEEIQKNLGAGQVSVLYSEWDEAEDGTVNNLVQRVEQMDPNMAKGRIESEVFSTGRPVITGLEGHYYLAEPFFPEERLIVFGGGHVALPLVEFAAKIGYAVTVVDDREEFANRDRFPLAAKVVCMDFVEAIPMLQINERDYVCVITRGHAFDEICVGGVLSGVQPRYLGMIGSRRHVAMMKDAMRRQGHSEQLLDTIHSPIGLPIGAISIPEIAISILAELIQERRMGSKESSSKCKMDQDHNVVAKLAAGSDQGMAVLTILEANGSAPRKAGAKMIVFSNGKIMGSIGGGGGEAIAIRAATELIGTGRSAVYVLDLTQDAAAAEGLVCGGRVKILAQDVK